MDAAATGTEVVCLATAQEKRLKVRDLYRKILGRNRYSQALRDYCFKKYRDGNYYSDCSSSISYCYKEAGIPFGILNTVGMYESSKLKKVDVTIKNGVPQEVDRLRLGDMLLFAGGDSGRAYAGYVGHVEMIGEINGERPADVVLYGHGSGTPSKKNMQTYCKQRQAATSGTKRGNKGLIKVVRFVWDDEEDLIRPDGTASPEGKAENALSGIITVKDVQKALTVWDRDCLPRYGVDGEWGAETEAAVKAFQTAHGIEPDGELNHATLCALGLKAAYVKVFGGAVNVRTAPDSTKDNVLGIVHAGDKLPYQGEDKNGWHLIVYKGQNAWISGKWTEVQ